MSERFDIKKIEEALEILGDKEIKEVIGKFQEDTGKELKFSGIYISREDLRDSVEERVFDSFNQEYLDLKSKISYLRKHGEDVNTIDFNLLRVPLKIKLFSAEFSLKNYKVIFDILEKTKKELSEFKLE